MTDANALAKMPSMPPPPGLIPNFVNPYSLEKWIVLCAVMCLVTATLFVAIHMYTKCIITRSLDWADYTCCFAWLGLIIDCTLGLFPLDYGLGVHQWNVPLLHLFEFLKYLYVLEIIFGPIIFLTELSLLLLYMKIFVVNHKSTTYILIQLVLWVNFLFYTAMTLSVIFMCSPIRKFWKPTLPGHCANSFAIIVVSAVFNVVSNFATAFLPVRAIWQLQMPMKRKLGVSTVFMAGLFACFASIMRLYLTVKDGHSPDVTYNMTAIMLWTVAEITTGIICGCLPYMPQFFHHFAVKLSAIVSRARHSKYFRSYGSLSSDRPCRPSALPRHERKAARKPARHPNDLTSFDVTFSELKTNVSEAESVWGLHAAKGLTTTTMTSIDAGAELHRHDSGTAEGISNNSNNSIVKTTSVEQYV